MIMVTDTAPRRVRRADRGLRSTWGARERLASWPRILVIFALCAIGLWLTFSVGFAAVVHDQSPSLALRLWPWDARALAVQADALLQRNSGSRDVRVADALARKSLARDSTSAPALRIMGFVKENLGDLNSARATIRTSERLSRRDFAGQLWLINDAVARGQAEEALGHFDIALRTSELAPAMLFPILASATEDPRLIEPLADVLAKRPAWGPSFISTAIHHGPAPENIVALDAVLRARGVALSNPLAQQFIDNLVARNRFADAFLIYNRASGKHSERVVVRDGDFDREPQFTPFDWMIGGETVSASRFDNGTGTHDYRLTFSAPSESFGDIARQLLILPPGRYRTSFNAGVTGAQLRLSISCAGPSRSGLAESVSIGGAISVSFSVPKQGCDAQWFAVVLPAVKDPDGAAGWIDNVTVISADKA